MKKLKYNRYIADAFPAVIPTLLVAYSRQVQTCTLQHANTN